MGGSGPDRVKAKQEAGVQFIRPDAYVETVPEEVGDPLELPQVLGIASHRKTNARFRKAYVDWCAQLTAGAPSQEKFLDALLDHWETNPPGAARPRGVTASRYK